MHARKMVLLAALLAGATAGCQHIIVSPLASPPSKGYEITGVALNKGNERQYQFDDGYRLVVSMDESGKPVRAQAYDANGNKVPTMVKPRSDVRICVKKEPDWKSKEDCEPLLSMPYETYFKSGTGTTCYLNIGGHIIPYQC
jgi:hypothetical protein